MLFSYPKTLMLVFLFASACAFQKKETAIMTDNPVIEKLYRKDIEIRELDAKTDTVILETYDQPHRNTILQLLAQNKVITPKDKLRAALILQHTAANICNGEITSLSPENYLLAYHLSMEAYQQLSAQNDTATIRKSNVKRMIAVTYDRYLLFSVGYQKYGTQFVFDDKTGEMLLAPIDTTLANDAERIEMQVDSLSVLKRQYKIKQIPKAK